VQTKFISPQHHLPSAAHELIAHNRNEEEVAAEIGADRLIYQEIDDMIDAVTAGNKNLSSFDCSVFTGDYINGEDDTYFSDLQMRRENEKSEQEKMVAIDMSNTD